jgi:hypothetical protein
MGEFDDSMQQLKTPEILTLEEVSHYLQLPSEAILRFDG